MSLEFEEIKKVDVSSDKKYIALCVAEKPSVALKISEILSEKRMRTIKSYSKYNPVYEFEYILENSVYILRITSVCGHLKSLKYSKNIKNWSDTNYDELFYSKLEKEIISDSENIVKTLRQLSIKSSHLIIWTDCDREGEAIGFDIIDICKENNSELKISRAIFSCLSHYEIKNAMKCLTLPNLHLAEAVYARQEIDLRLGSSFTRLQTVNLNSTIQNDSKSILSYGPCQFPTLGFVYERWKIHSTFKPQKNWTLKLNLSNQIEQDNNLNKVFDWERSSLFDEQISIILYEKVLDDLNNKKIQKCCREKIKIIKRPFPLNTISFQKLACKLLKISSSQCMRIAEKLYNKGLISYPRTETNSYKRSINLKIIIEELSKVSEYSSFASKILSKELWSGPNNGKSDDNAHPPIHPIMLPSKSELNSIEKRVYDLICRQFLASISKDSKFIEKIYSIQIGEENFIHKTSSIKERGFQDIIPSKPMVSTDINSLWEDSNINIKICIVEQFTQPPPLYTESDLIDVMDRNRIGTDATIHEHIKTVLDRNYCYMKNDLLYPSELGILLVEAYRHIGVKLYKPYLRAQMENEMDLISKGLKDKDQVVADCLEEMKRIFDYVKSKFHLIKEYFEKNIGKTHLTRTTVEDTCISTQLESINELNTNKINIILQESLNNFVTEICDFQKVDNTDFTKCENCKLGDLYLQFSSYFNKYKAKCTNLQCSQQFELCSNIVSISIDEKSKCFNCEMKFERTILNHHRSRIFFENNTNATVTVCIIENCDDTLLGIRKMILDQSNNQLRKIDNSIHREKLKENSSSSSIYPKRRSKFLNRLNKIKKFHEEDWN